MNAAMNFFAPLARLLETSLASVTSVPTGLHSFAVAGLIGGAILWLLGGKLLRPAFGLVGIAVGALIGGLLIPAVTPATIFGFASLHVGMTLGAILGLVLAVTLFRFAMGIAGAIVFAVLGVLGAGVYLSQTPGALPIEVPSALTSVDGLKDAAGKLGTDLADAAKKVKDGTPLTDLSKDGQTGAGSREVASQLQDEIQDLWSRTPSDSKLTITGGAFGGALLGLIIGVLMPKKSAALFTSFLGAASLLACGTWLAQAASIPGHELLNRGPIAWLGIWLVTGIAGVVIQTSRREKAARKAAPATEFKGS